MYTIWHRLEIGCGCFYVGCTKHKFKKEWLNNTQKCTVPYGKILQLYVTQVIKVIPHNALGGKRLQQLLRGQTFRIDCLKAWFFQALMRRLRSHHYFELLYLYIFVNEAPDWIAVPVHPVYCTAVFEAHYVHSCNPSMMFFHGEE